MLKYAPDQPRVPAGSSDGGQWTSGGGGGGSRSEMPAEAIAGGAGGYRADGGEDGDRLGLRLDIADEDERYGGHTVRRHVSRPDEELLGIVSRDRYDGPFNNSGPKGSGFILKY